MFLIGIRWNYCADKLKWNPKVILTVVYGINFCTLGFAFKIAFLYQFLISFYLVTCVFVGVKMQIIGLTGGIATGKSTVSKMLGDEGFAMIDADKINHDVCNISLNFK